MAYAQQKGDLSLCAIHVDFYLSSSWIWLRSAWSRPCSSPLWRNPEKRRRSNMSAKAENTISIKPPVVTMDHKSCLTARNKSPRGGQLRFQQPWIATLEPSGSPGRNSPTSRKYPAPSDPQTALDTHLTTNTPPQTQTVSTRCIWALSTHHFGVFFLLLSPPALTSGLRDTEVWCRYLWGFFPRSVAGWQRPLLHRRQTAQANRGQQLHGEHRSVEGHKYIT